MSESANEATSLNALLIKRIERFLRANRKRKPNEAIAINLIPLIYLERICRKRSHEEYPSVKSVDYSDFDPISRLEEGNLSISNSGCEKSENQKPFLTKTQSEQRAQRTSSWRLRLPLCLCEKSYDFFLSRLGPQPNWRSGEWRAGKSSRGEETRRQ